MAKVFFNRVDHLIDELKDMDRSMSEVKSNSDLKAIETASNMFLLREIALNTAIMADALDRIVEVVDNDTKS